MILILNGSPNKNSKTMHVVNTLLNTKEDIKTINAYDLNISSCDDCKYCEKKIGCVKKDDMQEIYKLLEQANTLLIASPIYFGAMTDKMMKLINRFQRYYSDKFIHNIEVPTFDNLILVSTQGSQKVRMFNGALETMHILERLFAPTYYDSILIPYSDNTPLLTKIDLDNIKKIKEKMI